jgi:hypothetical protein
VAVGIWVACGGGGGSNQNIGTTSAKQSVTLSNTGNASLSISVISIAGTNPGDFGQTNNCGSSVAAGANCTIAVTFTPSANGSRSASLDVGDNASESPQTVSLTGMGATLTSPGTYKLPVFAYSDEDSHSVQITVVVQ